MILDNKTAWDNKTLKGILLQCTNHAGVDADKKKITLVKVKYTRGGSRKYASGSAFLGQVTWNNYKEREKFSRWYNWEGGWHYSIQMNLPHPSRIATGRERLEVTIEFAQVFLHEMNHAYTAMGHREMLCVKDADVSFLDGTLLMTKEEAKIV